MRATVPGLAARRSIRAQAARISSFHGMSGFIDMFELPRPPHARPWQRGFPRGRPVGAFGKRIRVALEHDQRGGARRMCCREQRRWRERAVDATRTASRLPRSSSTAVMLSAHCSNVGSAPGVTGSDAPVPGWSKKMSRPSEVIASNQPWMDGSSGKTSQHVNQSGRTRCREDLRATRDRRRASPRSSHSASPRTPPKSRPRNGQRWVSVQRIVDVARTLPR